MLITGEGMYVWGKGVYWEISISLSSFAVNLKLLYKNKSYEEKKKKKNIVPLTLSSQHWKRFAENLININFNNINLIWRIYENWLREKSTGK